MNSSWKAREFSKNSLWIPPESKKNCVPKNKQEDSDPSGIQKKKRKRRKKVAESHESEPSDNEESFDIDLQCSNIELAENDPIENQPLDDAEEPIPDTDIKIEEICEEW